LVNGSYCTGSQGQEENTRVYCGIFYFVIDGEEAMKCTLIRSAGNIKFGETVKYAHTVIQWDLYKRHE